MNSSSMSPDGRVRKLPVRELVILSLMGAVIMGGKVAMAPLPNIEPATLLIILCTLVFGVKAFYPVYVYVLLECLVYGFGLWSVNYLYIWAILVVVTLLLRKNRSYILWTAVAGAFGLGFGALCSIPYFFIGGWEMAFSYWVSGIPFDLLHCAGNLVMAGVLLKPLHRLMDKLLNNVK